MNVQIRRAYEAPAKNDGHRILVDRLWPRGVSREAGHIDLWLKDLAPSNELRKWFGHEPEKWSEFRKRYHAELQRIPDALAPLREQLRKGRVTLLFGAKDTEHNNAVALLEFLKSSSR